jgi:hypothetical protein
MPEVRLIVRCTGDSNHAKVLRIQRDYGGHEGAGLAFAKVLGRLLSGTSPMYIHPPGEMSPIGFCRLCGEKLTCVVEEVANGKEAIG